MYHEGYACVKDLIVVCILEAVQNTWILDSVEPNEFDQIIKSESRLCWLGLDKM